MADIHYHGPVVAFDLDDTLFPEYDWAVGGYRAAAQLLKTELAPGLDTTEAVAVMERALRARKNPFDALREFLCPSLAEAACFDRLLPALLDSYRYHQPELTLFPDAAKLLETLSEKGIRMALVTDGRGRTQRQKIEALGIGRYFHPDDILISEETGAAKPSLKAFIPLVRHYPEASRFCYVGDNVAKDFTAPNALGWITILAPQRSLAIHTDAPAESEATRPQFAVESLPDVLSIINIGQTD